MVKSLSGEDIAVEELTAKLLISKPAPDLNAQGNLRIMSSLKPTETFMLTMKLAFFAGIALIGLVYVAQYIGTYHPAFGYYFLWFFEWFAQSIGAGVEPVPVETRVRMTV